MRITLDRIHDAIHFEAHNHVGEAIDIGTAEKNGGLGRGVSPMQLILMAVAGCTGIDVLMILAKARQKVETFHIDVDGERDQSKHPAPFTSIHVHYTLTGELDSAHVERAVRLSMERYCSASANLRPTSIITYSFEANGVLHACTAPTAEPVLTS